MFHALYSMSSYFFLFGITGKYTEDFAVGMFISLCYIYSQHPSTDKKVVQLWKRLSPWLWTGGILILVFSAMWHFKSGYAWSWPFIPTGMMDVFNWLSEMLLAIGFGACIAALLYGSSGLKALFKWPMLRWVGLISFSLYIWHLPLHRSFSDSHSTHVSWLESTTQPTLCIGTGRLWSFSHLRFYPISSLKDPG